jgi:hypothetical protein
MYNDFDTPNLNDNLNWTLDLQYYTDSEACDFNTISCWNNRLDEMYLDNLGILRMPTTLPRYITVLHMTHNGMTGTIPETLADNNANQWFDVTLSYNNLTGQIPNFFGKSL